MTNGLGWQHGALNASSARFCLARTGFQSWSAKNGLTACQNPNFPPFSAQKRLRNGWGTARGTAEKRLGAQLALLLDVMNDRGKFHSHRTRHRGGWAELLWWCPWAVITGGILKCRDPACTHPKTYHIDTHTHPTANFLKLYVRVVNSIHFMQNGDGNRVKTRSDKSIIFSKKQLVWNLFLGAICSSWPDAPFAPICSTKSKKKN
jgi:hypothetical protein